jgi:hypothetical protein
VADKVDKQLKGVTSLVEQQTRNLREDLSRTIEAKKQDVAATRRDVEATGRYFEAQLATVQARKRSAGDGNVEANADKVKFDGSTFWAVLHRQLKLRLSIMIGSRERRPLTF